MKNWSVSKCDTFLGCRRLFKYRYLKAPFSPPPNKYFAIGNLAHKALELFHQDKLKDSTATSRKKRMVASFKKAASIEGSFDKVKKGILSHADIISVRDMLKAYLKHLKVKGIPNVKGTESRFTIRACEPGSDYGVLIRGVVDRLDKTGDTYTITDYKTGRPLSQKDVDGSVQLPTYALWLHSFKPEYDGPITGKYVFLTKLGKPSGIKEFEISQKRIDEAIQKYLYVDSELKNNCEFRRNSRYKYCFNCDFRAYCFQDKNNGPD